MTDDLAPPYRDVGRASLLELEVLVSPVSCRRGEELNKAINEGRSQDLSKPGSQQIEPTSGLSTLDWNDEVVSPPIDLRLWASQLARNTRLNRGVRIIARNTVGLGWSIVPTEKITEDTPPEEVALVRQEQARVKAFFDNLHPMKPFQTLFECEVIDEEATGNGYLEFTRTGDNSLQYVYQVPSVTVRVLRDGRGFVQIRGGEKRYFKPFGQTKAMDALNGRYEDEEGFGGDDFQVGSPLPLERRATELIHFALYSPLSDFYGLPRFIPAGAAIAGNFHAARRNVAFFMNDAVPRMAVTVSGGALHAESKEALSKLFQEGQGPDEAHRILVLQTTTEGVGVEEKNQAKIDLKPLTVNTTEDGSFLNYRRMNDEEIRESLGLSEVYFKSEKLTKASAVVAKSTTDEQEFEPARILKETIINKLVVQSEHGLNAKRVRLRLARPDVSDPKEKSEVHKNYSAIGVLSVNEARVELGLDPYPESEEWGKLPLPVALMALKGEIVSGSRFKVDPNEQDGEPSPDGGPEGNPEEPPTADDPSASSDPGEPNEPVEDSLDIPEDFVEKVAKRIMELPQSVRQVRTSGEVVS